MRAERPATRPSTGQAIDLVWRSATVTLAALGYLLPMAVLAITAGSTRWFYPQLWPHTVDLSPARTLLRAGPARDAFVEGATVSGSVAVVATALAWPAARALARHRGPLRSVAMLMLLLPATLPAVGLAIGIDVVLLRIGLAGTFAGVVVAHLVPALPYAVASLTASELRHDPAAEDQAAVLGATPWQRLRWVTLPALRGALALAGGLAFLVSWSQYVLTLLVGQGRIVTPTMTLFTVLSGGNPTVSAALALAVTIPAVLVTITAVRPAAGRS